ncbi:hypothetical protein HGRIS_004423 [Hohenbuehelia grisea]|uniref:Uncharacterized protein n=1 Tax=Hohenbuehelia grisea TaxID=104357 RepID=A0ABR3JBT2_9AGAR
MQAGSPLGAFISDLSVAFFEVLLGNQNEPSDMYCARTILTHSDKKLASSFRDPDRGSLRFPTFQSLDIISILPAAPFQVAILKSMIWPKCLGSSHGLIPVVGVFSNPLAKPSSWPQGSPSFAGYFARGTQKESALSGFSIRSLLSRAKTFCLAFSR